MSKTLPGPCTVTISSYHLTDYGEQVAQGNRIERYLESVNQHTIIIRRDVGDIRDDVGIIKEEILNFKRVATAAGSESEANCPDLSAINTHTDEISVLAIASKIVEMVRCLSLSQQFLAVDMGGG